ncbi:MAG: alpha/beta hydrolase, partial [Hymenobacteraceae bacterium]|nr:alpha/beta hydrolase [Hymenobacteraceae bacterium]
VENLVPPMIDHINARPITRTNLAVLLHPGLQQLSTPPFPITIAYGEDDIFGDTTRYVRERYPAARFITIPNSSHFPWLHNEEEFYKVLADHFGMPPFSDLQP